MNPVSATLPQNPWRIFIATLLQGDTGGYHTAETGASAADDGASDMKLEMKPSTDHLMQSMALSGSLSGYPVTGRSHKCQEGKMMSKIDKTNEHNYKITVDFPIL